MAQVEAELERLRLHKATGQNKIPNFVLKCYAPTLAGPIWSIFNASIALEVIPSLWKCADVIPVPKVPKPKSVDSDLTPVLSKILEHFVSRWLKTLGTALQPMS